MAKTQDAAQPLAVRPAQAAEMLGVARLKIYHLIKSGKLKAKKDGNVRLILVDDIKSYLNELPYSDPKTEQEDEEE